MKFSTLCHSKCDRKIFCFLFQFMQKLWQTGKSERIHKMCAVFSVFMQYHNVTDRKRMCHVVCRVVNIELRIDGFQCFPLRPSPEFRQFPHIHLFIILRHYGIQIILGDSHTFQTFRSFKAELIQFRIIL